MDALNTPFPAWVILIGLVIDGLIVVGVSCWLRGALNDRKKAWGVNGEGFSRAEFPEEERAKLRHRNHILDDEHLSPEDFADRILQHFPPGTFAAHDGLGWLSNLSLGIARNKLTIAGLLAALSALNWQTVSEIALLIGGLLQ